MDLDPSPIARSPFAVGAVGALITALKFTPGAGWKERALNVACGSAAAGFITPALTEWLKMTSHAYVSGAAFLLGLLGMSLAAAVLEGIRNTKFGEAATSWITRKG